MMLLSAIRGRHIRQQIPIREIQRRTGLLRKTIRKYFLSDGVELQFTLPDRPSKLDPLANKLLGWPRQGVWKLRKQKRTTKQLHAALVALDNDGSYRRVVAFVCCGKADLQREQQSISRGAFVPLAFAAA